MRWYYFVIAIFTNARLYRNYFMIYCWGFYTCHDGEIPKSFRGYTGKNCQAITTMVPPPTKSIKFDQLKLVTTWRCITTHDVCLMTCKHRSWGITFKASKMKKTPYGIQKMGNKRYNKSKKLSKRTVGRSENQYCPRTSCQLYLRLHYALPLVELTATAPTILVLRSFISPFSTCL